MASVITREELEAAKKRGDKEIIISGDLADKLKKAKKLTMVSAGTLTAVSLALAVATVAAPATGGMSYIAAAPVAALSGVEIAAIIFAATLGLGLLIALFKDYEEISYSEGNLVLRKRQGGGGGS